MGMIMKDGVPYGGVYPIDDVPTQGSDNTVKSGGVFSSLSNKVDKVEGKGLSTNDYSDTEKGKVSDNASAIEAIVNVTGSCNVLQPYLPVTSGGGVTLTLNADGTISCPAVTSTNPDGSFFVTGLWKATANGPFKFSGCPSGGGSNTYFHYLMEYPSNGGSPRVVAYDYGDGEEFTVTSGYTYEAHIFIKTAATSLLFKPMLYDARLNPTGYVPYAMTNRELTDKVDRGSVSVVADGVKTYKEILNELFITATRYKIVENLSTVKLDVENWTMPLVARERSSTRLYFGCSYLGGSSGSDWVIACARMDGDLNHCYLSYVSNGTFTDFSSFVPSVNVPVTLYF